MYSCLFVNLWFNSLTPPPCLLCFLQMCVHVMKQKKCHYIGNCSFAHSLEERDVWTYMKNNSCTWTVLRRRTKQFISVCCRVFFFGFFKVTIKVCNFSFSAVRDMQQMYELWLQLTNQSRRTESSAVTPPPDDKQVNITADYTDGMVSGREPGLLLNKTSSLMCEGQRAAE